MVVGLSSVFYRDAGGKKSAGRIRQARLCLQESVWKSVGREDPEEPDSSCRGTATEPSAVALLQAPSSLLLQPRTSFFHSEQRICWYVTTCHEAQNRVDDRWILINFTCAFGFAVLLYLVCLFDLACFFLSSFSSLIKTCI